MNSGDSLSTARAWLRLFRVVNLPTVPGDVLAGAAAVLAGSCGVPTTAVSARPSALAAAALAAVALYLFGLVDNDIVGAGRDDATRPIPSGRITRRAARVARALCLFAAPALGLGANLPPPWWWTAFALAVACVVYNRTKNALVMGLCRGLNVLCGGAVLAVSSVRGVPSGGRLALVAVAGLFTAAIASLTWYSKGEESDPARRRRVGLLVGAIVYLQLGVLLLAYWRSPVVPVRNMLLIGAGLLVLLRLLKRALPGVSAS